jgi:hypothetical protein
MLERTRRSTLPAGEPQAEPVPGWLDEDRHLVAVVLAAVIHVANGRARGG